MICQEVMKTDVQCIGPQTTVKNAAILMRDQNIGFLPVCDGQRRVLGTITDRDIAIRIVAADEASDQSVAKFLTPRMVACRSTDDLSYAEELMSQEKVSRIMCVDESGQLEGVLSLSDLSDVEHGTHASATLRNVSQREIRRSSQGAPPQPSA
jgi:CBS domain-containing protein